MKTQNYPAAAANAAENKDHEQEYLIKPVSHPYAAPTLVSGGEWLNSSPLTINELKGKVVLIDFWTYSCINCLRTLPYITSWDAKYRDQGLVIIGVHSPEFAFEKKLENVNDAIKLYGIRYPVMQDNNYATWNAYSNQYWPAKYFIDKDGNKKDCPSEDSNMYWTPHLGVTRIHGVKEVIRAWRETNNIVSTRIGNNHPTVKPQALMDYLIRLVTPPSTPTLQRKVLDPFMGSGSTGMAAVKLGHHFTGCDLDEKYIEISKTRIEAWNTEPAEVISERISAKVKKAREKRLDPNLFGEPE